MFDWFRKPKQTHTVVGDSGPKPFKPMLVAHKLRAGMWVVYENQVGVLTNCTHEGVVTVVLADEQGINKLEVNTLVGNLRQAKYEEIPEPRRNQSKAWFEGAGYV